MTKINLTRTYDASKDLQTEAGKELEAFIQSNISSTELMVRALKNGISFGDNINCLVKTVELRSGQATVVAADAKKRVDMVLVGAVGDKSTYLEKPLHWYYSDKGDFTVVATFNGTPTVAIPVKLVILF